MNFPAGIQVHPYRPAAWLRVAGPDAATFLQGQFTQDIRPLGAQGSCYGLWLDRKGRVFADGQAVKGPGIDEFWVLSLATAASALRGRLEEFLVADEVEVSDSTGDWQGVALLGPGAGPWLNSASRPGFYFRGRRQTGENWEWILPASQALPQEMEDAPQLGEAELERLRILSGIPSVPRDIGPADLPNEGGLDETAISYSKGCYLGQEVMARVKAMGRIRRRLTRLTGPLPVPPLPAPLWQEGRKVGELRSAAPSSGEFVGLALLMLAGLTGAPLSLSADGPASLRIEAEKIS